MKRIASLPFGVPGCAVLSGRAKDPDGFIETAGRHPFSDRRVYVSAEAVKIMGNEFGLVERDEHTALREELRVALDRIDELELELAEADRFQSNIDGLTRAGLMLKKAPGRPPKTKAP